MHHCLLIPEIVQHICDSVDGSNGETRNLQLFHLAQTCRTFVQPALANLWEILPDMIPIIYAAGGDVYDLISTGTHDDEVLEVQLTRSLSPSDIATMKKYAALVLHFGQASPNRLSSRRPITFPPDLWKALLRATEGTALFPNLHSIHIQDWEIARSIALFSTQHLTNFAISLPQIPRHSLDAALPHILALLDSLAQSRDITTVSFKFFCIPEASEGVVAGLSNWRNLSEFLVPVVTPEVLQALSLRSSSLRVLTFLRFDVLPLVSPAETLSYPLLRAITIRFPHFLAASWFFEHFSAGENLCHIRVLFRNKRSEESDWLALLQLIKKYGNTLKKLEILEENFLRLYHKDMAVPLSKNVLTLLGNDFGTLMHVDICHRGGFDIEDRDMKILTEAMPQLRIFNLTDRTALPYSIHKITIACLLFFAQNCLHLEALGLDLDARADKIPKEFDRPIQVHQLAILDVMGSNVDDLQPVANFISEVFPNIQQVYHSRREVPQFVGGSMSRTPWYEISRLVGTLTRKRSSGGHGTDN